MALGRVLAFGWAMALRGCPMVDWLRGIVDRLRGMVERGMVVWLRGMVDWCWGMVGWLRGMVGWCWGSIPFLGRLGVDIRFFLPFTLTLSFTFTLAFTAEPAALALFTFILYPSWLYPNIFISNLRDGHQLPLLNICGHRLFDELRWWWLKDFLMHNIGLLDNMCLVDSYRALHLPFTVLCDWLVSIARWSEVDVTIVLSLVLALSSSTTFGSPCHCSAHSQ